MSAVRDRVTRAVLMGPAALRRAAARRTARPEEAWMLRQPRAVRESYLRDVVEAGEDERLQEIWMLRQDDDVRESYAREVLGADAETPLRLQ